jgi:hypothetical protein
LHVLSSWVDKTQRSAAILCCSARVRNWPMAALTVDRVTRAAIKGSADPKPRAIGAITTVGSQKGMSARLSLTGTISSRWCSYQTSSRCRSRSAGGSAPSAQHSPAGAAPACRHSPFPAGKRSEPGSYSGVPKWKPCCSHRARSSQHRATADHKHPAAGIIRHRNCSEKCYDALPGASLPHLGRQRTLAAFLFGDL